MHNFEYYAPTRVVFGKNTESEAGRLIKEQNCRKVLIHYGSKSAVCSGLLGRIYASLDAEGIPYISLGGVVPNPRLSKVREGISLCRKEGVDFILAVGGGSVIDSAKAIGYGMANEGDVWDFYARKRTACACLPIGAVLTIAAAGSEMSNSSVITNEDGWIKRGYSSNYSRCRFAILNPELTCTLPDYQTQSGCVDIMMHTLERYLNQGTNMEITDQISEGLLRTVIKSAKTLREEPKNYEARAEVMWAGLAAKVLMVPEKDSAEETALAGIKAMEDFFQSIGMPVTLRELGIEPTEKQILELAEKCSFGNTRTIGIVKKLNREDMAEIYRMAKG